MIFNELAVVESWKGIHKSFTAHAPANLLWAAQTGICENKSVRLKQ